MSDHRIFGSELSPYSVKVRSYFRYKGLPHEWIPRSPAVQAEFQKYAKLPLVPLVVTPEGEGVQDSTPIIERFEAGRSEPSIVPDDPTLAFISALLEEYGDEWGNKWMFHYRWRYQPDAWSTAERIAQQMMGAQGTLAVAQARAAVAERMMGRLGFVGSNDTTQPTIEASFKRVLGLLEAHLQAPAVPAGRPAGDGRFRPVGPALRGGDRSDARRDHAGLVAQGDGMGAAHGLAQGGRSVRDVVRAGADPDAASQGRGRRAVPAVDGGECRGHRASATRASR